MVKTYLLSSRAVNPVVGGSSPLPGANIYEGSLLWFYVKSIKLKYIILFKFLLAFI